MFGSVNVPGGSRAKLEDHLSNKENPHEVSLEQIGAAPADHTHDLAGFKDGILGIERGGTGVESYNELREELGLGDKTSVPLPIYSGGTGARSEKDAYKKIVVPNLGGKTVDDLNQMIEPGFYCGQTFLKSDDSVPEGFYPQAAFFAMIVLNADTNNIVQILFVVSTNGRSKIYQRTVYMLSGSPTNFSKWELFNKGEE